MTVEWKRWDAVPVEVQRRDEWGAELAREAHASGAEKAAQDEDWCINTSMASGDTIVLCRLLSDGSVELMDCLIRREARILKETP